jgi:hypothetical protein
MTGMITVTIWHNVTRDAAGRHTGPLGFTPGDQMVKASPTRPNHAGARPGRSPSTRSPLSTALRPMTRPLGWPASTVRGR